MTYLDIIDFQINKPYEIKKSDRAIINKGIKDKLKWSDDYYSDLKVSIRTHLRPLQKGRCGFCRLRISKSQFYPHLEHIVPKGANPEFEFEAANLVWSCQRCNFGKGVSKTLIGDHKIFPNKSDAFLIVNPYHDKLSDHIELIEDLIMVPKIDSTKGENTIDFYKLARIELAEDRAFELKTINNDLTPAQIVGRLTLRLTKEYDPRIIAIIDRYISLVPNWIID